MKTKINRNLETGYAQIPKSAILDEDLSFEAKGIFAYIMSLPNHRNLTITEIVNPERLKEGKDEVMPAIAELQRHGYCLETHTKENGITGETRYTFDAEKHPEWIQVHADDASSDHRPKDSDAK